MFFFLVLLLSFVNLQVLLAVIMIKIRSCMVPLCIKWHTTELLLVLTFPLWLFLLPHLIGTHEIWIGRIKPASCPLKVWQTTGVWESVYVNIEGGQGVKKEPGVFVVKALACNQIQRRQSGGAVACLEITFHTEKVGLCYWAWHSCILNLLSL